MIELSKYQRPLRLLKAFSKNFIRNVPDNPITNKLLYAKSVFMIVPSMLRKIILFLSIPPLALIATTIFIELGFNVRQQLDTLSNADVPDDSNVKDILFIGDSILGFLKDPHSLASQIKDQLDQKKPQSFRSQEISKPSLRSSDVVKLLSKHLRNNPKPSVVILMVGKGDYTHDSTPAFTFLSRFRLFRLLEFSYWDLERKMFVSERRWSPELDQKARPAWELFGQDNCKEALPHFEEVVAQGYQFSRSIKALLSCYIEEKKFSEGADFFEKIEVVPSEKVLVEKSIQILRQHPRDDERPTNSFSPPKLNVESRTDLRFQMWTSLIQNQPDTMFDIYKNAGDDTSDKIHAYTRNNLVEILNLLDQTQAQIFVLQYPLDHLSVLSDVLPSVSSRVHMVDLRSFLLQLPPKQFASFWQEDIEHLSAPGTSWLAEQIAPMILSEETDQ